MAIVFLKVGIKKEHSKLFPIYIIAYNFVAVNNFSKRMTECNIFYLYLSVLCVIIYLRFLYIHAVKITTLSKNCGKDA